MDQAWQGHVGKDMDDDTETWLKALAREQGFADCGITTPNNTGEAGARLLAFLAAGHHGDMHWMVANADRRADPLILWPEARSIIVLTLNYGPSADPMRDHDRPDRGVISCYAQGKDYHAIIKPKLVRIARALDARTGASSRVFVDTAPLMEKPLAALAGLGWQGKHTNLVSRSEGSWTFLAAILTSAQLVPDEAETDHCGTCHRCLDVCPTQAFPAPYRLDATRCIAYLTIEHKGHIPVPLRRSIGNRIFGCDDCLAVCPWNKYARAAEELRLHPRVTADNPPIADLIDIDTDAFRKRFEGTPVKRTGRDRFLRNVLIAAGNSGEAMLAQGIEVHLSDPAAIVRLAAVWSLAQLLPSEAFEVLRTRYLESETDDEVRREWLSG